MGATHTRRRHGTGGSRVDDTCVILPLAAEQRLAQPTLPAQLVLSLPLAPVPIALSLQAATLQRLALATAALASLFAGLFLLRRWARHRARRGHTRVLLLSPGSAASGSAMQEAGLRVYVAFDKAYDVHGRRYPPDWGSMINVALDEETARARGIDVVHIGRGRANPRNLATWASRVYDSGARTLSCISLDALAAGGFEQEELNAQAIGFFSAVPESSLHCLVCGSRGGQVTLPALWLLGCRLPAVVVNGGCARDAVAWAWPAGVPVVMLTGGADFFNEYGVDEDAAYLNELWSAVPLPNRPTSAILHVPRAKHRFDAQLLRVLLPQLVRFASSGLAKATRPVGHHRIPTILVTEKSPSGVWLLPRIANRCVHSA